MPGFDARNGGSRSRGEAAGGAIVLILCNTQIYCDIWGSVE